MKKLLSLVLLLSSLSASAKVILSEQQSDNFGGYWVDVEKTQKDTSLERNRTVTIADALNAQRVLRECLQKESGSFSRNKQTPFVEKCLMKANAATTKEFAANSSSQGLNVIFDMDETVLTQWSIVGRDHPEKTTFIAKNLDITMSEKDGILYFAPKGVSIRPNAVWLIYNLMTQPNVSRIFFFSAREDESAKELANYFLTQIPYLKGKYGGLFARNSLRFDATVSTPSKDLRMIVPSLQNVVLVDDNPGRVIQKELNFSMPKFNADLFTEATENRDVDVLKANNLVMRYVFEMLVKVSRSQDKRSAFYPYSTKNADEQKLNWHIKVLTWMGFSEEEAKALNAKKVYDQEYTRGESIKL